MPWCQVAMREQSLMKSLFFGAIDESLVFPWPEPQGPEVDRVHAILDGVRRFFELRVDSAEIDRQQQIPGDVLVGLRELGLFGLTIPQSYGGQGLSNSGYARAAQEMTGLDSSVALTLRAHQSIGSKGIVIF